MTDGSAGKAEARPRRPPVPPGVDAASLLPRPGLFASRVEKRYHEGIHAFIRGDSESALLSFSTVLAHAPESPSPHLFSALAVGRMGGPEAMQIGHLEAVVESRVELPDRWQAKYLPPGLVNMGLTVRITDRVSARAALDLVGAALMLAEHYQHVGRLDEAIGLVQQLHAANPADTGIMLSLCDLLSADGDYEGVVEVARDASNSNDLGVALLHLKGGALFALGRRFAALAALRDALAKTANRDPDLLKAVRYHRALAHEAMGQNKRARRDLERLFAADPDYEDVRERLAARPTNDGASHRTRGHGNGSIRNATIRN
jgi:tetratricopeptide (TPR) repeat protein